MKKNHLFLAAAAMLGLASCNSSEFEGYTKAENGLHYKFYNHDEKGSKPVEGDGIAFKYVIRIKSTDSVLVDSKMVVQDGSGVFRFMMPKSSFVGSVEDAMMMMAKGDSASFIVSADSFFLKTNRMTELPKFVKPGEHLQVDLKMVDVKTKAELEANQKQQDQEMQKLAAAEKPAIDKYIADNKITAKPTASGLYYIEEKKGKGPLAKAGDEVTVNYRGTTLGGFEFDSSAGHPEPLRFVIGQGQVIPGWEEAFKLMAKGGKAKFVIPSNLAYGPQALSREVPAFSTLVFEVELLDIQKPAAPAEGGMPSPQNIEIK